MSSPALSILTQCVAQAQDNIDLTGVGEAPAIPDAHVLGYVVPYKKEERQRFQIQQVPALVFSVTRNVRVPAAGGDNCRYVAFYTVLAQILHTDHSLHTSDISSSVMQWEYRIRNYFHMGNLRTSADSAGNWYVTLSPVQDVDIYNEKLFHVFDNAVALIPITFKSNEAHGTGRV